jgi:hypothetical protein
MPHSGSVREPQQTTPTDVDAKMQLAGSHSA